MNKKFVYLEKYSKKGSAERKPELWKSKRMTAENWSSLGSLDFYSWWGSLRDHLSDQAPNLIQRNWRILVRNKVPASKSVLLVKLINISRPRVWRSSKKGIRIVPNAGSVRITWDNIHQIFHTVIWNTIINKWQPLLLLFSKGSKGISNLRTCSLLLTLFHSALGIQVKRM